MTELETLCRELLVALGEDPNREGLRDTPRRFANAWREFIDFDPGSIDTVFESVVTDQLVVLKQYRVWSMCEHHLIPFWADISVGYLTDGHVIGLSKIARIAELYAHRLQIQERLVRQIGDHLEKTTQAADVAVIASGVHLCMTMRGVRAHTGATFLSSDMRGRFRTDPQLRAEFLSLAKC